MLVNILRKIPLNFRILKEKTAVRKHISEPCRNKASESA